MSIYSDINSYTPDTKSKLLDHEAVYQSLNTILSTRLTERLFLPEFGWDIERFLFEPMTRKTERLLLNEVTEAVRRWDDRVDIEWKGTSVSADHDNNKYTIIVAFTIQGLGDQVFEYTGQLTGVR